MFGAFHLLIGIRIPAPFITTLSRFICYSGCIANPTIGVPLAIAV
ncbi:hypothetical protein [Clostridium beijerinckii]|nr:hypothetical protein [Clostridium beijerinckii]